MIEVYKTNVSEASQAELLAALLLQHFPGSRIDFDLEDCDKVLRIEGAGVVARKVTHLLNSRNCSCEALE